MDQKLYVRKVEPLIPASQTLPEITFRVIILSIVLTIILAASNVFLALKIGTTIAASIPASVLAIGVLRMFRNSNVLESNLIQTAASAGEGIAAAVAFTLPAMIILKVWQGFPYWETVMVVVVGGILGVFFSIPLRRIYLDLPTLRFPEGTAIGNVLRSTKEKGTQLHWLLRGTLVGGIITFCQTAIEIFTDNLQVWTTVGNTVTGFSLGFAPAPLAAGYIVGIEVGLSLLLGSIIGWIIVLPIIGLMYGLPPGATTYDKVMTIWSHQLRFVGVGVMLVGGFWTLLRLAKPLRDGLKASMEAFHLRRSGQEILRTDSDMPMSWVIIGVVISALAIYAVFIFLASHLHLNLSATFLGWSGLLTTLYVVIVGFLLAAIGGYFAGLVGSTNNPLSGIIISGILILGLMYLFIFSNQALRNTTELASLMILIISLVASIATVANENLQDLKAGQMVGATPWKQQLILALGVIVAALVVPPVLQILFNAYGIGGVFPRAGMDQSAMLAAPQASLMAAVASGIIAHKLNWTMILIGIGIAIAMIFLDEFMKKKGYRVPVLAVGLGVYLPMEVLIPVVLGGIMNYLVNRKMSKSNLSETELQDRKQSTVLLACGLVAGNALMGVFLAIPFVIMGSTDALAIVGPKFKPIAQVLGFLSMIGVLYSFYYAASVKKSRSNQ